MTTAHNFVEQSVTTVLFAGAFETKTRTINALEVMFNPFAAIESIASSNTASRYRKLAARVLDCELQDGLIVPNMGTTPGMGPQNVRRTFEEIYDEAERDFFEKLDARPPKKQEKIVLIGHSLGAHIASLLAHRQYPLVDTIVAVAAPFEGIDPEWDKRLIHLNSSLRGATEWIRNQRLSLGERAPELHAVASERDVIIPRHSAHPDLNGLRKHTLSAKHSPAHEDMMSHPDVIAYCDTVLSSLAAPTPAVSELKYAVNG